jgi:hypothetical protein
MGLFEELLDGQYERLDEETRMLRCPIALQRPDRPTLPLYLACAWMD